MGFWMVASAMDYVLCQGMARYGLWVKSRYASCTSFGHHCRMTCQQFADEW